jgi:hypothetical protein
VAVVGGAKVGLLAAVDPKLDAAEEAERRLLGVGNPTELEDVEGTDADALGLRLAAVAVDHGHDTGARRAIATIRNHRRRIEELPTAGCS